MLRCGIDSVAGGQWSNEMKTNLLFRFFPRLATRSERELAYLSASVSIYDLECRQREIDRGLFSRT